MNFSHRIFNFILLLQSLIFLTMGIENFYVFFMATVVFVITPGMDTLFVLNKSLGQGRRSGFYASLGINSGVMVHTLLGALGVSLLIAQSQIGFFLIKYLGAGYIIFMGIQNLRLLVKSFSVEERSDDGKGSFWSGFLTNTLNPKVAIFFMAFFPQFISTDALESPLPFIALGIMYAILGLIWLIAIALFAGKFSVQLQARPLVAKRIQKVSGLIFIIMGLGIAMI